jgi:hypothetical protein
MNIPFRNAIICAALLIGWVSAGEPPSPLLWFSSPLPPESPVIGRWKVQFANGVVEACRISTNGTALVSEPERTSGGRTQVRSGATVIAYEDDRAERWTAVGAKYVVEHWCPIPPGLKRMPGTVSNPGFDFSHPAPVLGIADRVSETERFDWPDPTRDDTDGFMASSAVGGSMWLQLAPSNVNSQPLTFKVKTEKTPQGRVLYYVDVEPKKAVLSRNVAASVTVTSGKQIIARVDVKEKEYGNGLRFVFEVSPKYLDQSNFAFKDIEGREKPWLNDVYWFYLKDFPSEK